jgi:hypothetical protein
MNVFRRNDASNDPPKRRRGSSNEAARGAVQVDVNALGQQLQRLLERLESLTPRDNTRSPLQLKSSTSAYTHAGVWARLETLKRKHGALLGVPWPKALRCESDLITALMGNAELMTDTQVYIRQCEDEAASLEAQAAAALHPLASPVKVHSSNSMFSHTGGTPPLHLEQNSSSSTAVSSLSRKDSESSVLRRPSYLGKVSDKVLSGTRQLRASVGDRLRSSGGSSGGGAGAESDASRPPSPRDKAAVATAAAVQSPEVAAAGSVNGSATAERSSRTGSNSKAENPSISPVVATPPRAAWQEETGGSQKGGRFSSSSKRQQQQQQQSPEQQQQQQQPQPQQQRSRLGFSSSVGAHRYISEAYLCLCRIDLCAVFGVLFAFFQFSLINYRCMPCRTCGAICSWSYAAVTVRKLRACTAVFKWFFRLSQQHPECTCITSYRNCNEHKLSPLSLQFVTDQAAQQR